jgi:hypothetical protein
MLFTSDIIGLVEDILKDGCTEERLEEVREIFQLEKLEFKTEEEQKAFFQGMKIGLLVDDYSIDYLVDL